MRTPTVPIDANTDGPDRREPRRSRSTRTPARRHDKRMTYDPNVHHRRSIRLRGHDYAGGGAYYVTSCLQD